MRVLTDDEVKEWLAERGLRYQPYECDPAAFTGYYEQVEILRGAYRLGSVLTEACLPFDHAILHVRDWSHYTPDQMAIFVAARAAYGECRPLVDASGHLFDFSESDLLASLMGLAILFDWEAYLYFDKGPTFLNWDGELLDMWLSREDAGEVLLRLENSGLLERKKPDGFPSGS